MAAQPPQGHERYTCRVRFREEAGTACLETRRREIKNVSSPPSERMRRRSTLLTFRDVIGSADLRKTQHSRLKRALGFARLC
jgi:hypothetical protein